MRQKYLQELQEPRKMLHKSICNFLSEMLVSLDLNISVWHPRHNDNIISHEISNQKYIDQHNSTSICINFFCFCICPIVEANINYIFSFQFNCIWVIKDDYSSRSILHCIGVFMKIHLYKYILIVTGTGRFFTKRMASIDGFRLKI